MSSGGAPEIRLRDFPLIVVRDREAKRRLEQDDLEGMFSYNPNSSNDIPEEIQFLMSDTLEQAKEHNYTEVVSYIENKPHELSAVKKLNLGTPRVMQVCSNWKS